MEKTLKRDEKTGAVINTDVTGFELFRLQREKILKQKQEQSEMEALKQKVNSMSDDLSEIKQLLREIKLNG